VDLVRAVEENSRFDLKVDLNLHFGMSTAGEYYLDGTLLPK